MQTLTRNLVLAIVTVAITISTTACESVGQNLTGGDPQPELTDAGYVLTVEDFKISAACSFEQTLDLLADGSLPNSPRAALEDLRGFYEAELQRGLAKNPEDIAPTDAPEAGAIEADEGCA